MGEQSALMRQWSLLRLLCARHQGATIQSIAQEMEVCHKTIRRDIATFQTVGFPIEETVGEFGRKTYRLDARRGIPNIAFTLDESLALYLGRKALMPLAGTTIWDAAERVFQKIRASLGSEVMRYLDRIGDTVQETTFGWTDYSQHAAIVDTLLVGIEQRRVIFITYRSQSSTEPVTYPIHPYRLTRHQGSLYVIGYKPDDERLKTWRVDRVESATLDAMPFTIPEGFDLDAHFAGSFGVFDGDEQVHVRVRIWPPLARYVQEKRWHASQHFQLQTDGSVIVEFEVSNTVEVKIWLLGFGQHAEVLGPPHLRNEVAHELADMLAKYQEVLLSKSEMTDVRQSQTQRVKSKARTPRDRPK
ncbi:MAG: helix-turn-helix transcriptional regulator [Pirellulaceae bacterium]